MHRSFGVLVLMAATGISVLPIVAWHEVALAQQTAETGSEHLSPAELQKTVAPGAPYPDDLLSVVLPASTQPLQLVEDLGSDTQSAVNAINAYDTTPGWQVVHP